MHKAIYLEVLERETGKLIRAVHPYANEPVFLTSGTYRADDLFLKGWMTKFADGHDALDVIRAPQGVFSKKQKYCGGSIGDRTYGVAVSILNLPSDVDKGCLKMMIEFENLCRANESRWAASEMMGLGTTGYEKIGDKINKVFEENQRTRESLTTFVYGGRQHFAG